MATPYDEIQPPGVYRERSAYDPRIFAGAAPFYAKYRPAYPAELFADLDLRFALGPETRVLDLGCGTGALALPLAAVAGEVVGMDPDPEMLKEARRAASERGIENVSWMQGSSWELGPHLGTFRLVTIGAAFHWMDRVAVLRALEELVEPGGGVAILWWDHPAMIGGSAPPDTYEGAYQVIREVIAGFLGPERRAGDGTYVHPPGNHEQAVARASTFAAIEEWTYPNVLTWTVESIIGNTFSSSFGAPHLFGDRLAECETALRARLLALNPPGVFRDDAPVRGLICTRL